MFDLKDKVAVVTGAASGLGSVIAVGLAEAGSNVIIMDLPSKKDLANDVSNNIPSQDSRATYISFDLRDISSIETAFANTIEMFGKIDILINNAGVNILRPALNLTESEWDKILSVNLKGTFFCAKEAARYMIRQRKGCIINIASQFGVVGYRYRAAYSASKAGMIGLTRTLATEWAPFNIRVNSISPTILQKENNNWLLEDKEFKQEMLTKIPMGRFGKCGDILGAVIYLSSDEAGMITGHNLIVDGGWTAV